MGLETAHEHGLLALVETRSLSVVTTGASSARPFGTVLLLRNTALLGTMRGFRRIKVLEVIGLGNLGGLDPILKSLSQR